MVLQRLYPSPNEIFVADPRIISTASYGIHKIDFDHCRYNTSAALLLLLLSIISTVVIMGRKRKPADLTPDLIEPSAFRKKLKLIGLFVANRLHISDHVDIENKRGGRSFLIPRSRADVSNLEKLLGPYYFRRAYRMTSQQFTWLCNMIEPYMRKAMPIVGGCPNGPISHVCRVSAALRYCAGGSSYDIMLTHGMSHSSVFVCLWMVVSAVNRCPELVIAYPTAHSKQLAIAKGFQSISKAGFDTCAGIDGLLIWTEKPRELECNRMKIGSSRFLCGRKGKFGFNMQALCDS